MNDVRYTEEARQFDLVNNIIWPLYAPRGVEYGYWLNRSETRGNTIVKHLGTILFNEVLYKSNIIIIYY